MSLIVLYEFILKKHPDGRGITIVELAFFNSDNKGDEKNHCHRDT